MCPYYPAKEGLTRLTIAEVTEWELEMRVERKRAICSVRERGKGCCWAEESSKTTTHYPKPKNIPSTHKPTRAVWARACSQNLYTTFVCVLRLCHFALVIYETLQVPWRRCRALQFMSNLVNILSPVRPVSHCFSLFPMFSPSASPPQLPLVSSVSGCWVTERNQVWIWTTYIFSLIRAPFCCLWASLGKFNFWTVCHRQGQVTSAWCQASCVKCVKPSLSFNAEGGITACQTAKCLHTSLLCSTLR